MRKPEQKRTSKWDKKADMGILLLSHAEVGYIILINNKIIVARYVEFVEKDVKYIGFDNEILDKKKLI